MASAAVLRRATGKRIKELRVARKLSQTELADAVDVTRNAISMWEAGKSGIGQASLSKVAKKLDADVVWLQWGTGLAPLILRETIRDKIYRRIAQLPTFDNAVPLMVEAIGGSETAKRPNDAQDWFRLPPEVIEQMGCKSPAQLRVYRVVSEAIDAVPPGSHVFVDGNARVNDLAEGNLVVIETDGRLLIKRVVALVADNGNVGLEDDVTRAVQSVSRAKLKIVGRIVRKIVKV